MNNICYSVIIRTTGQAGEKYARLLLCISQLQPKPESVIVVLPEGSQRPKEQLGWESFYFCPKGMVRQRLYGLEQCQSPFALFCDDDVAFPPNFVQKLHKPLENGTAQLSAGPLLSFFPEKGAKAFLSAILGRTAPMIPWQKLYVKILPSSGYSYNRKIDTLREQYYPTESLPWTCFYANTSSMRKICLEEEIWLDSHGYAAMDDQTMFYKAHLRGIHTIVVSNAIYDHLDARTSTKELKSRANINYSSGFNRVVFWHRFLFNMRKSIFARTLDLVCFAYNCFAECVYSKINMLRLKKRKDDHKFFVTGILDGISYIKSKEYKNLPPVIN